MSRLANVITYLVLNNTHRGDDAKCSDDLDCSTIGCHECPLGMKGSTLGDIRFRHEAMSTPAATAPLTATEAAQRNDEVLGHKPECSGQADCSDAVHAPSHYMLFDNLESIEVIARTMTVSEFRGFCLGNVLKYRLRAGKKADLANTEQDLKKAEFYKELFEKHKGLCHG